MNFKKQVTLFQMVKTLLNKIANGIVTVTIQKFSLKR